MSKNKTIADVDISRVGNGEMTFDLAHEIEMFDSMPKDEQKDAKEYTEADLKRAILIYLHTHKEEAGGEPVVFNLLRGVAKIAEYKEQKSGVFYSNGEFITGFHHEGNVIRISMQMMADEEEIESMKEK